MTTMDVPLGLVCLSLHDASQPLREATRRFCLGVIKDAYGTDYRPDWHADLDSLAGEPGHSWFTPRNRGAFWALRAADGAIVATAGLYGLERKPALVSAFAARYPEPGDVTQLVRVYVRKDHRRQRIGRWLSTLAEMEAGRLGFGTLYLHANTDTSATIAFWQSRGFTAFASGDGTTHFDKPLDRNRDVPDGNRDDVIAG